MGSGGSPIDRSRVASNDPVGRRPRQADACRPTRGIHHGTPGKEPSTDRGGWDSRWPIASAKPEPSRSPERTVRACCTGSAGRPRCHPLDELPLPAGTLPARKRAHSSAWLERIPDKDEVPGSNPGGPTIDPLRTVSRAVPRGELVLRWQDRSGTRRTVYSIYATE